MPKSECSAYSSTKPVPGCLCWLINLTGEQIIPQKGDFFFKFRSKTGPKYTSPKINKKGRVHILLNVKKCFLLEKVITSPRNLSSKRLARFPLQEVDSSVLLLGVASSGKLSMLLRAHYVANGWENILTLKHLKLVTTPRLLYKV